MAKVDLITQGIGPATAGQHVTDIIMGGLSGTPAPLPSPNDIIPMGIGQGTTDQRIHALLSFGLGIVPTVNRPVVNQRYIPPSNGLPVTTRDFSWAALVMDEWGSEFSAPDHRVYEFANGQRGFDSTDRGETGIYRRK